MTESARLIPWTSAQAASEPALRNLMEQDGLSPYTWSNGPGETYAPHSHTYAKVIYVVRGSIEFILLNRDQRLRMTAGDRLDLPAGVIHAAAVGREGVLCLEAHR